MTGPVYQPDQLQCVAVEVVISYAATGGRREWRSGPLLMATRAPRDLQGGAQLVTELARRLVREVAVNPLLTMPERLAEPDAPGARRACTEASVRALRTRIR